MGEQKVPTRAASYDKKVGLVLQGGGPWAATQLAFMKLFRHPNTCLIGWPASLFARSVLPE